MYVVISMILGREVLFMGMVSSPVQNLAVPPFCCLPFGGKTSPDKKTSILKTN